MNASQNFEFFQEKNEEGLEMEPLSNSCQVIHLGKIFFISENSAGVLTLPEKEVFKF